MREPQVSVQRFAEADQPSASLLFLEGNKSRRPIPFASVWVMEANPERVGKTPPAKLVQDLGQLFIADEYGKVDWPGTSETIWVYAASRGLRTSVRYIRQLEDGRASRVFFFDTRKFPLQVLDAAGKPVEGISVAMTGGNNPDSTLRNQGITDAHGRVDLAFDVKGSEAEKWDEDRKRVIHLLLPGQPRVSSFWSGTQAPEIPYVVSLPPMAILQLEIALHEDMEMASVTLWSSTNQDRDTGALSWKVEEGAVCIPGIEGGQSFDLRLRYRSKADGKLGSLSLERALHIPLRRDAREVITKQFDLNRLPRISGKILRTNQGGLGGCYFALSMVVDGRERDGATLLGYGSIHNFVDPNLQDGWVDAVILKATPMPTCRGNPGPIRRLHIPIGRILDSDFDIGELQPATWPTINRR